MSIIGSHGKTYLLYILRNKTSRYISITVCERSVLVVSFKINRKHVFKHYYYRGEKVSPAVTVWRFFTSIIVTFEAFGFIEKLTHVCIVRKWHRIEYQHYQSQRKCVICAFIELSYNKYKIIKYSGFGKNLQCHAIRIQTVKINKF